MLKRSIFTLIVALAVLIPTGINLYQFRTEDKTISSLTSYRLPVSGFDPRDFARGRYATLQIDWQPKRIQDGCLPSDSKNSYFKEPLSCGFCLSKVSDDQTILQLLPTEALAGNLCDHTIQPLTASKFDGKVTFHESDTPTTFRVYLDEKFANQVDKALREGMTQFSADIVFKAGNIPVLRQFYINNRPYDAFFEQQ